MRSDIRQENRVRELRLREAWTQRQLARRARVGVRTLQAIEKGLGCRRDTKRKILSALGIPFANRGEVFPPEPDGLPDSRP